MIPDLERSREVMIRYLHEKLANSDWHGVRDACTDPKRVRTALGKLRAKGEAHAGGRGPRVAWHLGAGEPKADKPKPKRAKGRKPAATKRLTVEGLAAPVIMPATQDVTLPALMHALLTAPEGRVQTVLSVMRELRGN